MFTRVDPLFTPVPIRKCLNNAMTSENAFMARLQHSAVVLLVLLVVPTTWLAAQSSADQPAGSEMHVPAGTRENANRLHGVAGEITSLKPTALELKTLDGKTVRANLTEKTRYRKDRQPGKFSDFKVGDVVFVGGQPSSDNVWNAEVVATRSDHDQQSMRDALGKVFIVGEIKVIKGTSLVILRPDGVTQTIAVDENTSFRKDEESITLADFKPGDHVFGRGEVKDQIFVPAVLGLGEPRFMFRDEKEPH
jgi:hypothetical protein